MTVVFSFGFPTDQGGGGRAYVFFASDEIFLENLVIVYYRTYCTATRHPEKSDAAFSIILKCRFLVKGLEISNQKR